ncbi:hypothetical protein TNCV_2297631 [Trichonephila clavipes]|nr:hypothetical protein TNCV_2297631 [Trichonephila clavipes]
MNMSRYTNMELAAVHFICGLANGNGRAGVRIYEERYPPRRYWVAANSTNRIFEGRGSHAVDQNSSTIVREHAIELEDPRSRATVHRALQNEALHPFHVHRVQLLQPDGHPRCVAFAQ